MKRKITLIGICLLAATIAVYFLMRPREPVASNVIHVYPYAQAEFYGMLHADLQYAGLRAKTINQNGLTRISICRATSEVAQRDLETMTRSLVEWGILRAHRAHRGPAAAIISYDGAIVDCDDHHAEFKWSRVLEPIKRMLP